MDILDAEQLVDGATAQLRELGLEVEWPMESSAHDTGGDGTARLSWAGRPHVFQVDLKTTLRPSTAPYLLKDLAQHEDVLLVAPSISGRLADLMRDMRLNYIDLAGNCHISCPEFLIDIRGRRGAVIPRESSAGFTKTDLRITLARIVDPSLVTATSRELGERVGVSHGAAHLTVSKLAERGFLTANGLRRGAQLMDEWTQSYLTRTGAHRAARTLFVDEKPSWDRVLGSAPEGIQLSGESAAEVLGWPIRSSSAIVYADTFASVARLVRGRSHGDGFPIEVRTPVLAPSDNVRGIAASLLIHADMLASHDSRQIEVAQEGIEIDQNLRHLQQTV